MNNEEKLIAEDIDTILTFPYNSILHNMLVQYIIEYIIGLGGGGPLQKLFIGKNIRCFFFILAYIYWNIEFKIIIIFELWLCKKLTG